jgi:hypothetical protein
MSPTNGSHVILICTKNFGERHFRDKEGWVLVSARGRKFRATAEQVLNHLLPALAGIKPNVTIEVMHQEKTYRSGVQISPSEPFYRQCEHLSIVDRPKPTLLWHYNPSRRRIPKRLRDPDSCVRS